MSLCEIPVGIFNQAQPCEREGVGRTYEYVVTHEASHFAAPVYRIPFPKNEFQRIIISVAIKTAVEYRSFAEIMSNEVRRFKQ